MPSPDFTHAAHVAGAVRLNDVAPIATRWLWPGRIPLGRVTLLVSDPGLGKSLVALDVAARVSSGAPWPDGGDCGLRNADCGLQGSDSQLGPQSEVASPNTTLPNPQPAIRNPQSVLLLTAEDDLADTVRPRLEALGADCARIVAIPAVPGGTPNRDVARAFALDRDLARLARLLDAMTDCRLVILDPISAYLGGTNEHGNAEVRDLLVALATLARQRDLAVLAISHLRKKEGAAVYRTMGSLAFVAAARAAWVLAKDPAEPDRRLFLPIKNNLAQGTVGLAFKIEAAPGGQVPILSWEPEPVTVVAETVLTAARSPGRPDEERQHAARWLQEFLSRGPRDTLDVQSAADAHGIRPRTLHRAFRDLGGEAVKQPPFALGQWAWKLPGIDCQNPGGEFWQSLGFPDDFFNFKYRGSPVQSPSSTP
jgi:hypothetical protein